MRDWVPDDGARGRSETRGKRWRRRTVAIERPRRERRPQEKLARLIAAGIAVFGDQGYAHASVQAICRLAGVSVGTFYDHFEDKADLMLHVAETATEEFERPRFTTVRELEGSISALIGSPVEGLIRAWLEAAAVEPGLREAQARMRTSMIEGYLGWVREARSVRRSASALDAESSAVAVVAAIKDAITATSEPAQERVVRTARTIWFLLYGERPDGGSTTVARRQAPRLESTTRRG